MASRLATAKSPYLLQHAGNPVDWFPWGDEAFQRAREQDKPLLISIGYSACHWCHVMERESFENESTAALMNDLFVSVKVDREERPDVDSVYMEAVQAITGQGGWPLNVFVTPDGRPFFGGTYFPPSPRQGMPSWHQVLQGVAEAYSRRRADVTRTAASLTQAIHETQNLQPTKNALSADLLRISFQAAVRQFDPVHGGFGDAPKFPQPLALEFVLRMHSRLNETRARELVEHTLMKMADGGIFDQLGGGFHRYSVDAAWVVPHFEKMLYDNALLALAYVHAFQATGKRAYASVVEKILDYVLREMHAPQGGFYSSQDADSEGEEGKYYTWTPEQIDAVLPADEAEVFRLRYGVSASGNFEGATILTVATEIRDIAARLDRPETEVESALCRACSSLLEVRGHRVPPATDTKILLSWNALMIRALAETGRVLNRRDYIDSAVSAMTFLFDHLRVGAGWVRNYRDGAGAVEAFLEDHAFLLETLLSLYETTSDGRYLDEARVAADDMVRNFWDDTGGGFFDTASDADKLVVRPRGFFDNPIPSGNSAAAFGLLRLHALTGDDQYEAWALPGLRTMGDMYARAPLALGHMLSALDFYLSTPLQIGIVGVGDLRGAETLARAVWERYLPNRVLAVGLSESDLIKTPLLEARGLMDGRAAAYVCEHFVCTLPVNDVGVLRGQLEDKGVHLP